MAVRLWSTLWSRAYRVTNDFRWAAVLAVAMTVSGCIANQGTGEGPAEWAGSGDNMEARQAQLRQTMQGTGIGVEALDDRVRLNLPGAIAFAMDESELASQIHPALDDVLGLLEAYPDMRTYIAGYTDATGTAADNRRLSRQRAQSVADYLMRGGIRSDRLIVEGHGARHYVAGNDTPRERAQNRRVTLTLVPTDRG